MVVTAFLKNIKELGNKKRIIRRRKGTLHPGQGRCHRLTDLKRKEDLQLPYRIAPVAVLTAFGAVFGRYSRLFMGDSDRA